MKTLYGEKYRAVFACERFTSKVGLKFTWLSSALTLYLKSGVNPPHAQYVQPVCMRATRPVNMADCIMSGDIF